MFALSRNYIHKRSFSLFSRLQVIYKDKDMVIETPKLDKNGSILTRSINYFNEIDKTFKQIEKVPEAVKAGLLLKSIQNDPELLYLMASFHRSLRKIGIDQSQNNRDKVWRYRLQYFIQLHGLHNTFFATSKALSITEHDYSLSFNPRYLGILDPKNFSPEDYEELQTGIYKGTDFRHIKLIGTGKFGSKD